MNETNALCENEFPWALPTRHMRVAVGEPQRRLPFEGRQRESDRGEKSAYSAQDEE